MMMEITKPIVIDGIVCMGNDATILPGIVVGKNVIASCSVITKSLPNNVLCEIQQEYLKVLMNKK